MTTTIDMYPNGIIEIKNVYTSARDEYPEAMDHTFKLDHLVRMSRLYNKKDQTVFHFNDHSCIILELTSAEHETLISYWINAKNIQTIDPDPR
jgi:hypothetical protein